MKREPTREEVLEAFDYDEARGCLLFKRTWGRGKAGEVAGSIDKQGSMVIRLNGRSCYLGSLIWLLHTGVWSDRVRYHDDNKLNNHISNLFSLPDTADKLGPQDILNSFVYDRENGKLLRKHSYAGGTIGNEGTVLHGYLKHNILSKQFYVSDMIWFIETGNWPTGELEHVNGDGKDNRISNLREVSKKQYSRGIKTRAGRAKSATAAAKFVQQATEKHRGFYSYEKSEYVMARLPITVTCPVHGDFETEPDRHLRGTGCQRCTNEIRAEKKTLTQEQFLGRAAEVHGDTYDYGSTKYVRSDMNVEITCRVHGVFSQAPGSHLSGSGCTKCGKERAAEALFIPHEQFVERAKAVHGAAYDYSSISLRGMLAKIEIICKEHGPFWQEARSHLVGCGCPICAKHLSRPEIEMFDILQGLGLEVYRNDRKIVGPKELDIVLPEQKIAIEYCGIHWHSEKFKPDRNYHVNKLVACAEAGYRLLTIFEDEFVFKKELVLSLLQRMLGLGQVTRLGARTCDVRGVSYAEAKNLLESTHLQGAGKASHYYGLYHGGVLVSCASLSKHRAFMGGKEETGSMELVRYCQSNDFSVSGGLGKLVAYAKKDLGLSTVTSYVDRRWFTGSSYLTNGFTLAGQTAPNYWYIKGRKRINRFNFARHTLQVKHEEGLLPFYDPAMSESEIMRKNGYLRIYDCGSLRMVHA